MALVKQKLPEDLESQETLTGLYQVCTYIMNIFSRNTYLPTYALNDDLLLSSFLNENMHCIVGIFLMVIAYAEHSLTGSH